MHSQGNTVLVSRQDSGPHLVFPGLEVSKKTEISLYNTFGSPFTVVIGEDKYTTQIQLCTTSKKNYDFFSCYRTFALD